MKLTEREKWLMKQAYDAALNKPMRGTFEDWLEDQIAEHAPADQAIERLEDILKGGDGQVYKEAEKYLELISEVLPHATMLEF